MKLIKNIEKKIDDFFMKSMDYNQKEGIVFIVIFFFLIILTVGISAIFSTLLAKIGIVYVMLSFVVCMSLLEKNNKIIEYMIIVFLLPYILLLMFIDKMFLKVVPYRGDDPMLIRSFKMKKLKKKIRRKKIFG